MNAIIVASVLLAACVAVTVAAPGGYGHGGYSAPQSYSAPAPSYSAPAPSYGGQSYGGQSYGSAPAPSYGGQSYGSAPSYGGQSYGPAPQPYGHQSYSYASPAPNVRCGSNLLVGCAPSVAHVGCGSYSPPSYGGSYGGPSYGGSSYGGQSYGSAPAYKSY